MPEKKNKSSLISEILKENKRSGRATELSVPNTKNVEIKFSNLDVDSIKPKRQPIEYASVKIKSELFEQIKHEAERQGVRQPGKFISLILETYLTQVNDGSNDGD